MDQRNLTLLTDLYELTMMQGYFKEKDANETVVFDMFYRTNPHGNGFTICAGLAQLIDYIKDLHFAPDDIEYLRSVGMFEEDFLEYLRGDERGIYGGLSTSQWLSLALLAAVVWYTALWSRRRGNAGRTVKKGEG